MMTKKRRSITVLALVFLACAGCAVLLVMLDDRPGVTKANVDRLQDGMKMEEVEQILGGPGLPFHGFAARQLSSTFVWSGVDGSMVLVEVVDQSVIGKIWRPSTESVLARLRRWLHLPM